MQDWGPPYDREALQREIWRIYRLAKKRLISYWKGGEGDSSSALIALQGMVDRGEGIAHAVDAAKHVFSSHLFYPYAFRELNQFRDAFPDAFDEQELKGLRDTFRRMAETTLENWEEIDALAEIDTIETHAHKLGVSLASFDLTDVRELVQAKIWDEEEEASEVEHEAQRTEEPLSSESEEQEIKALFARLADDHWS